MPTEYVKCRVCNRIVRAKVPPGGDGTVLLPWRHRRPDGVQCTGHLRQGDPVEDEKGTNDES
jgi:hypothetical protein